MGGHRLAGLDAPEPGLFVPQVAETGDQHPLQGGLALLIRRRRFRRQFSGPGFELLPESQDGPERAGRQSLTPLAKPIARLRYQVLESRGPRQKLIYSAILLIAIF